MENYGDAYEHERLYWQWLEENHPEEFASRVSEESARQSLLQDLARGYRRPIFDAFETFNPSPTFIRGVITDLGREANRLLKEKQAWKGHPDADIAIPRLNGEHDLVLNRIKQLQYRLAQRERTGSWVDGGESRISDADIERAKSVRLETLYGERLRNSGGRLYGRCPFHNEKTGSFVIYEEQNSYHCYGCGEGGDVINFVQKQQNLKFIEAVRFLVGK